MLYILQHHWRVYGVHICIHVRTLRPFFFWPGGFIFEQSTYVQSYRGVLLITGKSVMAMGSSRGFGQSICGSVVGCLCAV